MSQVKNSRLSPGLAGSGGVSCCSETGVGQNLSAGSGTDVLVLGSKCRGLATGVATFGVRLIFTTRRAYAVGYDLSVNQTLTSSLIS